MEYKQDITTPEGIAAISRRIRIAYLELSHGNHHAEDCVQEILCRMLEGRHRHATIAQAVVDYIRKNAGDSRLEFHVQKSAPNRARPTEPRHLERLMRVDDRRPRFDRLDFEKCAGWITNQVDRACFRLFYQWGLTEMEIGTLFGFSESRAHMRIKKANKAIEERIKK